MLFPQHSEFALQDFRLQRLGLLTLTFMLTWWAPILAVNESFWSLFPLSGAEALI
jgi:hypothetical protein